MDVDGHSPEEIAEAQKIIRESLAEITKQPVEKWCGLSPYFHLT